MSSNGEPQRRSGRVVVREDTVWQVIEGRVVMLELDREHYYRLDEVGSRIWELLSEHGDIEAAHAQVLKEYDVDADTLRADIGKLVVELADAGLITIEAAPS